MNRELLQQTMQYIEDHPEEHEQRYWFTKDADCGTAACFAGWACLLSGYKPAKTWWDCDMNDRVVGPKGGATQDARGMAIELLGIDQADAHQLFNYDNSRETLKLMVKDLLNGEHLAGKDYE